MRLKIINPAADIPEELLAGTEDYLRRYLREDTEVEFASLHGCFSSVETEAQGLINGAETVRLLAQIDESRYDGVFINCFDDPAVLAGREFLRIPVLGPYEPALQLAGLLSERIAVISTDTYGLQCEERKLHVHRMQDRVAKIVNVKLGVLELTEEENLLERLLGCAKKLETEGIFAAVLGCTGMNYIAEKFRLRLEEQHMSLQIVEPLRAGIMALENMVVQGFTNRIGSAKLDKRDILMLKEQVVR